MWSTPECLIFGKPRVSNGASEGIPFADARAADKLLALYTPLETWLNASTTHGMAETATLASSACQALAVNWTYNINST